MADLILKVTPDEVSGKATEINTQKEIMDGIMTTMSGYVKTLNQSWNSDSGKLYVEKFENVKREINDSLTNLTKHVEHLNKAADAYRTVEDKNIAGVNALADNDIF